MRRGKDALMMYSVQCILVILLFGAETADSQGQPTLEILSECTQIVNGNEVKFRCKTDDFSKTIRFKLNEEIKAFCFPNGGSCISTNSSLYTEPDQHGGIYTDMTLLRYCDFENDGNWTCEFDTRDSDKIVLSLVECESSTDGKSCDEPLIYMLYFILTLVCIATTFFLVIWFNLRCPNVGKVVLIIIGVVVDLLFEIILLWGIEYGGDFKLFNSDISCPVVIIGVVCHVVAVVVEIVKVIVQYLYIEELRARIFVCCRPDGEIKKVRKSAVEEHPSHTLLPAYGDGRKGSSADNQSKMVAKPEDIMLFMHFTVPLGYTVNKWVTEENASIENNPKYVSNDRGTLLIKSATEKDNGIYQGILTSNGNEQRVNAVLHVTGQKSANLIINPLIWRQVKTKKLKKITDLKEIRHKVSRNDIDSIPTKNEDESNVSIKSIRWVLNGKIVHTLSNYKDGDDSVPPHTVTKNQPIDEYHCTVEFSNKKSHAYIFIVKFTGVRSGNTPQSTVMRNNKVDTVDDVVGVPTILSTRREETNASLPPLRHKATTAYDRQTSDRLPVDENNLHSVTSRSTQSNGVEDNL